jgi:hypothetical protein
LRSRRSDDRLQGVGADGVEAKHERGLALEEQNRSCRRIE